MYITRIFQYFFVAFSMFALVHPMQQDLCLTSSLLDSNTEEQITFDAITDQCATLNEHDAQLAANWLALHELLLENNYGEHLTVGSLFNNFEWDETTTQLIDSIDAIYQQSGDSLQSLFKNLDKHLAQQGSQFNFSDFKMFILARKEMGLAFWEFVSQFNTYEKTIKIIARLVTNVLPKDSNNTPTHKKAEKLPNQEINIANTINSIALNTTEYAKNIAEMVKDLSRYATYFDPTQFDYFYRKCAQQYHEGCEYDYKQLEKALPSLDSSTLAYTLTLRTITACKTFAEQFNTFKKVSTSIKKHFASVQENIIDIYEKAIYFKHIYALVYEIIINKIDAQNRIFLSGQLEQKLLPSKLFFTWNAIETKNISHLYEIKNALQRLINLCRQVGTHSKFSKEPDPNRPGQHVGLLQITDTQAITQVIKKYDAANDILKTDYPDIFEQWGHCTLFENLHAMTSVTLENNVLLRIPLARISRITGRYVYIVSNKIDQIENEQRKEEKKLRKQEKKINEKKVSTTKKPSKGLCEDIMQNDEKTESTEDGISQETQSIALTMPESNAPTDLHECAEALRTLLFTTDRIAEETDTYSIIRQSNDNMFGGGMTLVVYKNNKKDIPPFIFDSLYRRQDLDTFHSFSQKANDLLPYGDIVSSQDDLSAYNFARTPYLESHQKAVVLEGKIINNKYYRGNPQEDHFIEQPGTHNGAFVFIYDENTHQCFHRCFHETIESHAANHQH